MAGPPRVLKAGLRTALSRIAASLFSPSSAEATSSPGAGASQRCRWPATFSL